MNKLKTTLKKLWKDESAQGMTEYILILLVVVALVFIFKDRITGVIQDKVGELGDKIGEF